MSRRQPGFPEASLDPSAVHGDPQSSWTSPWWRRGSSSTTNIELERPAAEVSRLAVDDEAGGRQKKSRRPSVRGTKQRGDRSAEGMPRSKAGSGAQSPARLQRRRSFSEKLVGAVMGPTVGEGVVAARPDGRRPSLTETIRAMQEEKARQRREKEEQERLEEQRLAEENEKRYQLEVFLENRAVHDEDARAVFQEIAFKQALTWKPEKRRPVAATRLDLSVAESASPSASPEVKRAGRFWKSPAGRRAKNADHASPPFRRASFWPSPIARRPPQRVVTSAVPMPRRRQLTVEDIIGGAAF